MKGQIKALLFYISIFVMGMIFGALLSCARPSNKVNMRVAFNPMADTICADWSEDSTMTDRKRETLNEILAR